MPAHISFLKAARPWFAWMAAEHHFSFGARPSKELSSTFANEMQDRLILNALEWLGTGKKPQSPGGNQPGK